MNMTKQKIEQRIELLNAEISANEEENYWMECEIEELEDMLEGMECATNTNTKN